MIVLENPDEIFGRGIHKRKGCLGSEMTQFEILKGEEAFCADEEIFIEFGNGKEMRIYINDDKKLSVYTD